MDGEVIEVPDATLADSKFAAKLHNHNPPMKTNEDVQPGDLVVINGSKTKLKPREPHLVQDIEDINGRQLLGPHLQNGGQNDQ